MQQHRFASLKPGAYLLKGLPLPFVQLRHARKRQVVVKTNPVFLEQVFFQHLLVDQGFQDGPAHPGLTL